jgi:transposase
LIYVNYHASLGTLFATAGCSAGLGHTRHPCLVRLLERRTSRIAAVALANKIARIAWAMMARKESFLSSRMSPIT